MKSESTLRSSARLIFLWLALCLFFLPRELRLSAAVPYRIRTVVIDPGHGGHDAGCLGASAKEKHIALDIALKLGKLIENQYPEVKVIYTRTKDVFVELHERAAIANRAKADLFICIHANSSESPTAFGTETFVMGLHKTAENLAVARRENAAILYEKDYKKRYDGYDPNSPEAHIIFNLFQKAYMEQSLLFASKIQNEFEEYAGRFNRGVKQAGFLVLYRTAMPAVLIETGFLSNKAEEKYLLSEKGQTAIAMSIFSAFTSYKIDMESSAGQEMVTEKTSFPVLKTDSEKQDAKGDSAKTGETKINVSETKKDSAKLTLGNPVKEETMVFHAVDSLKPSKSNPPAPAIKKPAEDVSKTESSASEALDLYYTVQIGAVLSGSSSSTARFEAVNAQAIAGEDGYTRFVVGRFKRLQDAISKQTELRNAGFKDAYVTPYYKGKRISLKEAAGIQK
jgi:N-acetylmuramoyl-L-alanine amidase